MNNDINKYSLRGFKISDVHADNEFDVTSLKSRLQPTIMHFYAKGEHIGII